MTEPRKSFTSLQRLKIFEAAKGICHLCGAKIHGDRGETWDVEHVRPLSMGGTNDEANLRPAHTACHSTKSRKETTERAKADRIRARHFGARKPSSFRKLPEGWKWDWKSARAVKEVG